MKRATCCGGDLRSFLTSKLGRCMRCMRIAAFGGLAGWLTVAAALISLAANIILFTETES